MKKVEGEGRYSQGYQMGGWDYLYQQSSGSSSKPFQIKALVVFGFQFCRIDL